MATLAVSAGLLIWSGLFVTEWLILACALVGLSFLGFLDDINPLAWRTKLVAQSVSACIAVLALPPIGGTMTMQVLAAGTAAVAFVTLINFTNFVDGIDEMTTAHGVPALAIPGVLASLDLIPLLHGIVAAAGMGALMGFWWWNRHPARIFFGDAGSLSFGLLLAWSALLMGLAGFPVAALLSITYLALDAGLTLLARWRAGARLTRPHREHAFQRAVDGGFPTRTVTGIVFLASIINAILAVISALASPPIAGACLVAGGIVALAPVLAWLQMPAPPATSGRARL